MSDRFERLATNEDLDREPSEHDRAIADIIDEERDRWEEALARAASEVMNG